MRGSLEAGAVTYAELFGPRRRTNAIVRTQMRGTDVKRLLEEQFSARKPVRLHVSGLTYRTDPSAPAGARATAVELADGRPLEAERSHTVAASELLTTGERFSTLRAQRWAARPVGTEVEALVAEVERRPAALR